MTKIISFLAFFVCVFIFNKNLKAQVIPITGIEPQTFYCPTVPKDTLNKLFIHGRVVKKQDLKKGINRAVIQLKGNDIYTNSDSLGYYWLDISQSADGAKSFTIQCTLANYTAKDVVISHRIIKTTLVNFEMDLNGGIAPTEMTEIKKPVKKKRKAKK